ncbi:RING finger protein 32-like [Xenopus laevis]|uniref:RING finger protein 32-like n=1 Tax=Xenopus laevis TaxID=8355 RepID=A0A8J0VJP5_XENLA|nr:RING finger protein 32-like [Xenopus laevis]
MYHHLSSKPSRTYNQATNISRGCKGGSYKQEPFILTAVAIQDHILQNLQLQHLSLAHPVKGLKRMKETGNGRAVNKYAGKPVVDTGIRRKVIKHTEKPATEEEYVLDPAPQPLTLAQKLGIVRAPALPLTNEEWLKVKQRSVNQGDSLQPCVICKEPFGIHSQVLLSCSHVFHRACLEAYERFTGRKTCPMCRRNQYQTRVIYDGARIYKANCATRIQACWRGYIVRKWYKKLRQTIPPKNPKLRRKFFEEKFTEITDRLLRSLSTDIDVLFNEIDHSVAASRKVLQQVEGSYTSQISEEEWERIQIKAARQEIFDCPICIMPLCCNSDTQRNEERSSHSSRPVVLLSCSHVFHQSCLHAFEEFTVGESYICPLCRSPYKKKLLPI